MSLHHQTVPSYLQSLGYAHGVASCLRVDLVTATAGERPEGECRQTCRRSRVRFFTAWSVMAMVQQRLLAQGAGNWKKTQPGIS
eukprot:352988-Chlamydomonas_euryale.AAC.5